MPALKGMGSATCDLSVLARLSSRERTSVAVEK